MSYAILLTSDAEADLADAMDWYRVIDAGLEKEFLRAVNASLSSISRNPAQYPLVIQQVRRALLSKFPYGVFYFVYGDVVVVFACFHNRRKPEDWQARI